MSSIDISLLSFRMASKKPHQPSLPLRDRGRLRDHSGSRVHHKMKRSSGGGGSNTSKKIKSKTMHSKSIDDTPVKVVYISNPVRFTTSAAMFRGLVQKLTGRDSNLADHHITAPQQQQQQQIFKQKPAAEHAAVASPSRSASEEVIASAAISSLSSSTEPPPFDMIFAYRFISGDGESSYNINSNRHKNNSTEMIMAAPPLQVEGLNEDLGAPTMQIPLEGYAAGFFVSPPQLY